jgi:hypothetical protein
MGYIFEAGLSGSDYSLILRDADKWETRFFLSRGMKPVSRGLSMPV